MYRSVISEGLMDTPTLLRYIEQNYKIASTLSLYLDALVSDPRKYILDSLQIGDNPSPSARDTQLIIGQQFTIWKDRFSPEEQSALVLRYGREILPHPRIDMNPENDTKRIAWVNEDIASGNFFSIPDAIKPTDILDLRTIKTTLLSKGEYETLLRGSRMFDLTLAERHEYTMAILRDLDRFSIRNFFEFVDQGIVPVSTYPSIKTTLEAKDMIYTMVYSQIYPQYYGTSTLVEILIAQDRIGNLVEHINKLKPNAVQTTKLLGIVLSAGQRYQEYVGGVIRYQEAHFGR